MLELVHGALMLVLASNGLQDATAVQRLNNVDDAGTKRDVAVLQQNPVPDRVVQIPYDAFHLLPYFCSNAFICHLSSPRIGLAVISHSACSGR
ncbi:hypothetical protein D3C84_1121990 [compost metagenome]